MVDLLSSAKVQAFILAHENDDVFTLALNEKKYPDIPIKAVVQQIKARQKARTKLPAWHQADGIIFPSSLSMEQCSSELTAQYKAEIIGGGTLIDLTGGAGVDSYYFSKSFKNIHYVEQEVSLCEGATHNFEKLRTTNIKITNTDAISFLKHKLKADCVYLDPARRGDDNSKIFKLEDSQPNILELKQKIFEVTDKILLKTAPMLDIQQGLTQLENVSAVYVVAVKNDCKEVLYLLEKDFSGEAEIITVNLKGIEEKEAFRFYKKDELEGVINFSMPKKYIYEPNAAILKAGAFRSVASEFQLDKLHPNSHLYTSDELLKTFPGRVFVCEHICKYDKKTLRKLLPDRKANITVRNFPNTVQEIRKKTGIKAGGAVYLFATMGMDEKPMILVCRKGLSF